MKLAFRSIVVMAGLILAQASSYAQFGEVPECCLECSCAFCGEIQDCLGSPFLPEDCNATQDPNSCGIGGVGLCSTFWQNNSEGVTGASVRPDGVPTDCIPIDGGLGFWIAGGLGIGVIGIRRRKEEPEVECA